MAIIRPNLDQYWPKRAIFQICPKNQSRHYFLTPETRLPAKIRKFLCFRKKNAKTIILGHFGQKRPILDHFWPKRGHFRSFGEKAKTSLFYSFFFIFQYKKSENSNAQIFGKMGTYERTNERTNGAESKGPSTPSTDQKN